MANLRLARIHPEPPEGRGELNPLQFAAMEARHAALAIEHVEGSSPSAFKFKLTRLEDCESFPPVPIVSPYEFPVEGRPNSPLMRELRWYLEQFLDYPFHPETGHAEHVLDALRAWETRAFNALFDRRDGGNWLAASTILQVRADAPHILSWPWEALYDPRAGGYLAHQRGLERRLNRLPDPQATGGLPNDRVNILLVVCRPYEGDVRYRSIARPLIELIQSRNLPAHVDILRPPTFDRLREHLRQHPGYHHVLHFDGHGAYASSGHSSPREVTARHGYVIFENEKGRDDPRPARDIAALLDEYAVPAVVLNACQSATLDEQAEDHTILGGPRGGRYKDGGPRLQRKLVQHEWPAERTPSAVPLRAAPDTRALCATEPLSQRGAGQGRISRKVPYGNPICQLSPR